VSPLFILPFRRLRKEKFARRELKKQKNYIFHAYTIFLPISINTKQFYFVETNFAKCVSMSWWNYFMLIVFLEGFSLCIQLAWCFLFANSFDTLHNEALSKFIGCSIYIYIYKYNLFIYLFIYTSFIKLFLKCQFNKSLCSWYCLAICFAYDMALSCFLKTLNPSILDWQAT